MTTAFISDLHLSDHTPQLLAKFHEFLKLHTRDVKTLYILGDLFELYIGPDDPSPCQQEVCQSLKRLNQRGVDIYFMPGNRDFLVCQRFLDKCGATLLPDPYLIEINQTPILLTHGDTLCLEDTRYLRYRKIVQNRWVMRLFLAFPLSWRLKIANGVRKDSQRVNTQLRDATPNEVERLLSLHQAKLIIHGHTHIPTLQMFDFTGNTKRRIVLSDWGNTGNQLRISTDNDWRLSYF